MGAVYMAGLDALMAIKHSETGSGSLSLVAGVRIHTQDGTPTTQAMQPLITPSLCYSLSVVK